MKGKYLDIRLSRRLAARSGSQRVGEHDTTGLDAGGIQPGHTSPRLPWESHRPEGSSCSLLRAPHHFACSARAPLWADLLIHLRPCLCRPPPVCKPESLSFLGSIPST